MNHRRCASFCCRRYMIDFLRIQCLFRLLKQLLRWLYHYQQGHQIPDNDYDDRKVDE